MKSVLNALRATVHFYLIVGMASASFAASDAGYTDWEFFAGKTPRGTGLCSLNIASTGAPQRSVSIKQLSNSDAVSITVQQSDWAYPAGTNVQFRLDFADQQPLMLKGYGDGQVVDVQMPKNGTAIVLSLLGDKPSVRFQMGTKSSAWTVPLSGVRPKLKEFVDCAIAQDKSQSTAKTAPVQTAGECKIVRFTGLAATRFPYELEDALKQRDLEDYVARNPILCNKNNSCRGIGYFENARGRVINEDGKYLHVIAPVDFTTGRRDIYLAIFRKDARCSPE